MDKLVKYCKPEHNIYEGCQSIQLGTLDYYRQMDPSFIISDSDEGKVSISSSGGRVSITPEQAERLTAGAVTGSSIEIEENGRFLHTMEFPNSYIFCVSKAGDNYDQLSFAKDIDENYTSSYTITNISHFASLIADFLSGQIKIEDLDINKETALSLPVNFFTKLEVQVKMGMVNYRSRDFYLSQDNIDEMIALVESPLDWYYQKDECDSGQSEFRIAFSIIHPEVGIIPVKSAPKILSLNPLYGTGSSIALS